MELWQLKQRQGHPLDVKIELSKIKIREFYDHFVGNVYISFSGGKDSTVLLHLVRSMYPHLPGVFLDTGLEFPEIRDFVKGIENIIWVKPKLTFKEVLERYGYPVPSKEQAHHIRIVQRTKDPKIVEKYIGQTTARNKRLYISKKWRKLVYSPFKISDKCCDALKKRPFHQYERESKRAKYIGTMASEGFLRQQHYLKTGCNAFHLKSPTSMPLSFWKEEDIWGYIKKYKLEYSKIYDMGYDRTGCVFCMFGIAMQKEPNKFQILKKTHPKLWDYCINKLDCGKILDYINIKYQ